MTTWWRRIAGPSGDEALAAAARALLARTLAMRLPGGGVAGFPACTMPDDAPGGRWQADPGLLCGAAGVGLALLRRRFERMAPFAAELLALERAGRLSHPVAELAGSFIHMFANRIFRSAANEQELVVYDLLARLHASRRARAER